MGEAEKHPQKAIPAAVQTMIVDTLGGRIQVSWDQESAATPMGQMVFFAAYLETTGLFDTWVEESPLHYTSPNAPQKRDVLGTLFFSILAGHRRYVHVTALRSDGVSPNILGMRKIVSEDALRRALGKTPEAEGTEWMRKHLFKSVVAACQTPWILDIDTTIKPLCGHQEGAEVGYNPHKLGRPSHAYRGIENICNGLKTIQQTTERLLGANPWDLLVSYIVAQITQKSWVPHGAFPALVRTLTAFLG
ncbi:MAG: hypothetical protein PHR95_13070 [Acidithiobacillus sp.]|nr:hypothetical protein [Acidithiobacillus sp.]MDD5280542.1 hypothetical protein [Acidithiobacillus sp.]